MPIERAQITGRQLRDRLVDRDRGRVNEVPEERLYIHQNQNGGDVTMDTINTEVLGGYTDYVDTMVRDLYNATGMPADMVERPRGRRIPPVRETYAYGGWEDTQMRDDMPLPHLNRNRPIDEMEQAPLPPIQPIERTPEQNFKREFYMYKLLTSFDVLANVSLNSNDFVLVDPHHGRAKYSSYFYDYNSDFIAYYRSQPTEEDKSMFVQMVLNKYEAIFGPDFV